jgi:subtilisin-like proprotein convertase family protein
MRLTFCLSVSCGLLLGVASALGANFVSPADAPNATPVLLRELNSGAEAIPVVIGVKDGTPSARALMENPDPEGETQRRTIRVAAQKRLAADMTPQRLAVRHYYESFSMLAGTASRDGILTLANRTDVAWVDLDRKARPLQTAPQSSQILIRSDQANAAGFTGTGQTVAVIDTGVDYTISALGGGSFPNKKVIGGTDISDKDNDPLDCEGHGTEVSEVIAGPNGVAPDAKIVAIKVFPSKTPDSATCQDTASFSDIYAGIGYSITNKAAFGITAINLSLGGSFDDTLDHGYCDTDDPASATAIDSAVAAGLVVAVAGGNDGLSNQLADPACVSSAVSVGAVYADNRSRVSWLNDNGGILCTDQPAAPDGIVCFSDSMTNLSLLAPGAFWGVANKGGAPDTFSGTSASTPAVAGAVALLRQARPDLSPQGVVGVLRMTGKPITDSRNGVVTPRIDTLAAVQLAASGFGVSTTAAVPIPDASGSATATATVSGVTRPMASVQVWVEIDHPEPEQLRLTLIGPDGTTAVLRDQTGSSQHPINAIYGKTDASAQSLGVFAGKAANGVWTLKVEDLVAGATGRIKVFAVNVIPGQPIEAMPPGLPGRTLPVVAHTQGTKFFLSDVRVYNPGPVAKTFSLYYVGEGQTGATAFKDTRVVQAGQVLALNDVLLSEYNLVDSIGQMTVSTSDTGFLSTSRAYNVSSNGTFGLLIPGLRDSGGIALGSGPATANGLAKTSNFHSNVGFTEVSGAPVTVRMDIFDGNGNLLASTSRSADPYTTILITDIISDRNLPATTNFRVDFTVTSATGRVVPFATYVDEATGDGSYQSAVDPASSADDVIVAQTSHVTGANSDFFRTDLDITNVDSRPVTVTVSLLPLLLTGTPAAPRVYTIAPGQTLEKLDVLASEFGLSDPSAAGLRIHPSAAARLAVSTRTSVAKFGGTFGFSVPGVPASTAIGGASTATVIQLDQTSSPSGYRSNFGFTEVAGADVVVRATVKSGDTGATLGAKSYPVPANTSFQTNVQDILGTGVTANNIYIVFSIDSGAGRVIPYGATVDNTAGDGILMIAE